MSPGVRSSKGGKKMEYNLKDRVPIEEPFPDYTKASKFDLSMRKKAMIPFTEGAKRVLKACKENDTVVNVGMGSGLLLFYLAGHKKDLELFGIEDSEHIYNVANDHLSFFNWTGIDFDIEFEKCSLLELPFEDNFADVVFSYAAMRYWNDPVAVLKECIRICKDDGVIIIEDHNRHTDSSNIKSILPMINKGREYFFQSLRASYSVDEVKSFIEAAGGKDWIIKKEDLNLIIYSKKI